MKNPCEDLLHTGIVEKDHMRNPHVRIYCIEEYLKRTHIKSTCENLLYRCS